MNPFVAAIVDELRGFAADLLDPGLAPSVKHRRTHVRGSVASVIDATRMLCSQVKGLIDDLEVAEFSDQDEEVTTLSPVRSRLSRRGCDYINSEGRLVPRAWVTLVPKPVVDLRPLGWLLHLVQLQREDVERCRARVAKLIEEALRARQGTSTYARNDREGLEHLRQKLEESMAELERVQQTIRMRAETRIVPTPVLPRPFPRAPSWGMVRRSFAFLIDPSQRLPEIVQGLLKSETLTADLPFLYQRWAGIKLIKAFESEGFKPRDDCASTLFLGGRVRFVHRHVTIELWVEPRIRRDVDHPCGLYATKGEVTPDYVLVTSGHGGKDAFILDPTMDTEPEVRASKGRYLGALASRRSRFVAGVPTLRHPMRAWAVAPLTGRHCMLESSDGSRGTVPMHPVIYDDAPIRAWLHDVALHAEAWTVTKLPGLPNATAERTSVP